MTHKLKKGGGGGGGGSLPDQLTASISFLSIISDDALERATAR